ncbi:MAG: hypothetical protein ACKVU1_18455 [bacterium]
MDANRLEWRAHPARARRRATAALVAFLGAVLAGIWLALRDPFSVALALVFLAGALAPWFLPTSFRVDAEGAASMRAGIARRRRWDEIRSVYIDARGVTLSPFSRRSWLEPYRAMRLLFAGNTDAVVGALERRLSERCRNGEVRWIAPPKTKPTAS